MKPREIKAIVTGGASGLGQAVAARIVAEGGAVTLLDINEETGAAAVRALGGSSWFRQLDVADEKAADAVLAESRSQMDGLNVAVSCAGVLGAGRVLGREGPMSLEHFTRTVQVNLIGSFNIARAAATLMEKNEPGEDGERGAIINTASVAAFEGQIGQAAYSASKGGVVSMTLPIAREFARIGIRVNTIAPGIFLTPMVDGMPPQVQETLAASIPFPSRLGKPDEFAQLVMHVITNSYLNGTTIRLDGAVRLQPK